MEQPTNSKIFVSIPSYRDPECQWTVKDLFEKAKYPDLVFIGICWQCDEKEDQDCFVDKSRPEQVRTKFLHWSEARGPCLARYHAQTLWSGEEYYLQIDSHMRFVKHWDEKLITMLRQCPNPEKAILTTYPVGYELGKGVPVENKPPFVVAREFGPEGMLRLHGKLLTQTFDKPIPAYFWVSGFAFSKSRVITEVPYDPYLPFLFFGEETLMNVRLWTHGYNFYAPGRTIAYHLWERAYRHTFREVQVENKESVEKNSLKRVEYLLGILPKGQDSVDLKVEEQKYGLGNTHNIKEYQEFVGIELTNKVLSTRSKQGGIQPELFLDHLLDMIAKMSQNT